MPVTLSFNVKDSVAADLETALAAMQGWTETITDANGATIPNPQNKAGAARQRLKDLAKNDLVEFRNRQAMAAAAAVDNSL